VLLGPAWVSSDRVEAVMIGAFPIQFVEAELPRIVGVVLLEVWNQYGKEITLSALTTCDWTNEF
jgi:hypothetical protein